MFVRKTLVSQFLCISLSRRRGDPVSTEKLSGADLLTAEAEPELTETNQNKPREGERSCNGSDVTQFK